jgi:hypothetical protein
VSSSRKHLNPATEAAPGVHPTRRAGGARRELSERVIFRAPDGREIDGWALNASRSGLRAIVEDAVTLGADFEVSIGEAPARPGRVVWLQEEKDGAIVGVNFLDDAARGGSIPDFAGTPLPPSARPGSSIPAAGPAPGLALAAETVPAASGSAGAPLVDATGDAAGDTPPTAGSDRPGP